MGKGYAFPVAFLMVILMLIPSASWTWAGDKLKTEQEKLKGIYKELKQEKEKLRKTKKEQAAVLNRLYVINRDLNRTEKDLNRAQNKIFVNQKTIGQLGAELSEDEKILAFGEKELRRRINEVYKGGGVNYLELLFSSKTLADFINRSYYFERVIDHDVKLIKRIKEEYEKIKQKKGNLESATAETKELAKLIKSKKNRIASVAEEKKQIYEALGQRRKEFERRVAELEKSSQEMEGLIKGILADRRRKGLAAPEGTGVMAWPLHGRLTSKFGYRRHPFWRRIHFHTGIDIAAPYGSSIKVADGGEVIFCGWWDGYGKAVVVDHGRDISTVYAHLSRIYVEKGQMIDKGHVVGLVGNSGYSTGPHLHFEVRKSGKPVDPLKQLP